MNDNKTKSFETSASYLTLKATEVETLHDINPDNRRMFARGRKDDRESL